MMPRFFVSALLIFGILLSVPGAYAQKQSDVIANVGNQIITFSEIYTLINSSSIVGLDIPAYGTPRRNTVRLSVLDKLISANLLYLDALKQGVNKNPVFKHDIEQYSKNMLASLYKGKVLMGEIQVSEQEVLDFFKNNIQKGTELTDDVKLAIEASIRKKKFKAKAATLRERLRKGVDVTLKKSRLNPTEDAGRKETEVVATVNQESIKWGDVKQVLRGGENQNSLDVRVETLNGFIDNRIMVTKAKETGLDQDPIYSARIDEYKKTRLINIHRAELVDRFFPNDKEIRKYFKKNKEKIAVAEVRKVQMVVLKTKKEAQEVKKKIESKEITIFEAARDYSIDPNAQKTLGEIGWVSKGTGFPELDKLTFSLKPDEVGGPVESPAGWHLVKVLDLRDALNQSLDDKGTWSKTKRMLIHEKIDQYVVNLRKDVFSVEVYEDVFNQIAQEEVDKIEQGVKESKRATP